MGDYSYQQRMAVERQWRVDQERAKQEEERARMELAAKITMMVTKRIEDELIRPGPVPEERECYDMAQELRDMAPKITQLVRDILKQEPSAHD